MNKGEPVIYFDHEGVGHGALVLSVNNAEHRHTIIRLNPDENLHKLLDKGDFALALLREGGVEEADARFDRLAAERQAKANETEEDQPGITLADMGDTILQVEEVSDKLDIRISDASVARMATVADTYAGAGANPVPIVPTPFGERVLEVGAEVQLFHGISVRGTATITAVQSVQQGLTAITLDEVPAGTVAGDFIRMERTKSKKPLLFGPLVYKPQSQKVQNAAVAKEQKAADKEEKDAAKAAAKASA